MVLAVLALANGLRNVHAHGAVLGLEEHALLKPLQNLVLALQVGLALEIELVERNARPVVCDLHAVERPLVHHLPKLSRLLVAGLPLSEHLLRHLLGFRVGGLGLSLLALQIFVEFDVALADEVVALHAKAFRGVAVLLVEELVGEHGLADVDSAVVDEVHLEDFSSGLLEDSRHGFAEGVVAQVSEMERLVRVRGGEFNHHFPAVQESLSVGAESSEFVALGFDF